jgi:LPS O-antigen subunit length determinant protein (WzzB/FepE family)
MEQTLVKFVTGLSEDASNWEKRINKKYGRISRVCKRIEYDIKHGVTSTQVSSFLQLIRTDPLFSQVRTHDGSMERLDEIQEHFRESPKSGQYGDLWSNYFTRQQ